MNKNRRQLKQLEDTIRMKQAVLEKQKQDVYELLDEFFGEILKKTEALLLVGCEHENTLDKAKNIIQELDKASELFTKIVLVTDSYMSELTEDPVTIDAVGKEKNIKEMICNLTQTNSKCSLYSLQKKKTEKNHSKKKPTFVTSPPDLNPKSVSGLTVQPAICTQWNTKSLLSPLEINTQNLNTSNEILSSCQTIEEISPQKDEIFNVVVIDVEHPWSFHVQLINNLNVEISQKIREYICSGKMDTLFADQGLYCLAKFEDGCFYRAKIKSVQGEMVSVKYVDYGNSQIVSTKDLYKLPPSLASFPANAIWCALEGVCPKNEERMWPEEVIQHFQQCINEQEVKIQRLSAWKEKWHDSHPWIVKVIFDKKHISRTHRSEAQSLSKFLIHNGLAKVIELYDLYLELNKFYFPALQDSHTEFQNDTHLVFDASELDNKDGQSTDVESSYKLGLVVHKKLALLGYSNCSGDKQVATENDELKLKVIISSAISPSSFFVHCVDKQSKERFETIHAELNASYNNISKTELLVQKKYFRPRVNSICCAMSSQDNLFYRGLVLDIEKTSDSCRASSEKLLILFMDFGDFQWVSDHLVFPLTEKLRSFKCAAVWCRLNYIKPLGNDTEWSFPAIDAFKTMVRPEKSFYIVASPSKLSAVQDYTIFQSAPLPVFLIDENMNGEEVCMNHELIELGLASLENNYPVVHSEEDMLSCNKKDEWDPMSDDFLSIRNSYKVNIDDPGVALVGYSSNQADQNTKRVCAFYNRPGGCRRGQSCRNMHVKVEDTGGINDKVTVLMFDDDQTHFVPQNGTKCLVTVTYVKSPDCFFVHFVNTSKVCDKEESLDDLMASMRSFYRCSTFYDSDLTLLAPGQAVAANVDGTWIRGKVLEMDVERSEVELMSVDFGSLHVVKENNIRALDLRFIHLTPQAVECSLSDIEPLDHLERWSEDVCNIFSDLTLGQKMAMEIQYRFPNGHILVSLCELNSMNSNISHFLVDSGLARKKDINRTDHKEDKLLVFMPG